MFFIKYKTNCTDNLHYFLEAGRQISPFLLTEYSFDWFIALQIIPCVIAEFTVQQGLKKPCVLASTIHLLCFSPPVSLFWCLYTTVAMITVAEQEAETNSPFSYMLKHWFYFILVYFFDPLGISKTHEENTALLPEMQDGVIPLRLWGWKCTFSLISLAVLQPDSSFSHFKQFISLWAELGM